MLIDPRTPTMTEFGVHTSLAVDVHADQGLITSDARNNKTVMYIPYLHATFCRSLL